MPGGDIDIEVVRENLEYSLKRFAGMGRPTTAAEDLALELYCRAYALAQKEQRMCGIARLLTEGYGAGLFDRLTQSAAMRVEFLEWAQGDAEIFDRYTCASHAAPFFDALAAGQMGMAKRIGTLSNKILNPDFEYPEDHAYLLFLFALVDAGLRHTSEIVIAFERMLIVNEGRGTARYSFCTALVENDQAGVVEALDDLLREHEALFAKKGRGIIDDSNEFATERFVCVEALAIAFVAEQMGFAIEEEGRFMPREARFVATELSR